MKSQDVGLKYQIVILFYSMTVYPSNSSSVILSFFAQSHVLILSDWSISLSPSFCFDLHLLLYNPLPILNRMAAGSSFYAYKY